MPQSRPPPMLAQDQPATNPDGKKYFELCVNTGQFRKTLGEIDVTQCASDGSLFAQIRATYLRLRNYRAKHFLLEPTEVHFVQVRYLLLRNMS